MLLAIVQQFKAWAKEALFLVVEDLTLRNKRLPKFFRGKVNKYELRDYIFEQYCERREAQVLMLMGNILC